MLPSIGRMLGCPDGYQELREVIICHQKMHGKDPNDKCEAGGRVSLRKFRKEHSRMAAQLAGCPLPILATALIK